MKTGREARGTFRAEMGLRAGGDEQREQEDTPRRVVWPADLKKSETLCPDRVPRKAE